MRTRDQAKTIAPFVRHVVPLANANGAEPADCAHQCARSRFVQSGAQEGSSNYCLKLHAPAYGYNMLRASASPSKQIRANMIVTGVKAVN